MGKKCKLGIFAPGFEMIQYTTVSLYYLSPLPEDSVEVSPESILQALWILPRKIKTTLSSSHLQNASPRAVVMMALSDVEELMIC